MVFLLNYSIIQNRINTFQIKRKLNCAIYCHSVKDNNAHSNYQIKESNSSIKEQRLSKVIASYGISSRRAAEVIINEKRVKVNDKIVTVPETKVHPKRDKITVDGKIIKGIPKVKHYFAFNKPKDVLCSSSKKDIRENSKTKIVLDYFQDWIKEWKKGKPKNAIVPRLFTVGRLDKESWGLIFVTNDGIWSQKISHPSNEVTKEYVVRLNKMATKKELKKISDGCMIDGRQVKPIMIIQENKYYRITITEGRNREIRRLIENANLTVKSLKRVRIGGYRLPSDLKVGSIRALKVHEVKRVLNKSAQNII